MTYFSDEPQTLDIDFSTFKRGLPAGHFRVIVNPDKARKYIRHRLMMLVLTLPIIGTGVAMGLWGYTWIGVGLVAGGVVLNRLVASHAPKILLYLASHDARVYAEAIDFEIMEVRAASDEPRLA
jgi:hypothetical protein